jgi:antitoxin (DNA-binding transcriptional repressor) of toxin-antitoxin stability system
MDDTLISIRELHARTGHYVRRAAISPVVVMDNGRPVAELRSLSGHPATPRTKSEPKWKKRVLLPGYAAIMDTPVGGDSTVGISEDRDRGCGL